MSKTTRQRLIEARDIIQFRGWVRGQMRDIKTGAVCPLGAIMLTQVGEHGFTEPEESWSNDHLGDDAQTAAFVLEDAITDQFGHVATCYDHNHEGHVCACFYEYDLDRVAHWNDTKGRTRDEVIAVFNYAIDHKVGVH